MPSSWQVTSVGRLRPLCVRELAVRRPTLLSNAPVFEIRQMQGGVEGGLVARFNSLILSLSLSLSLSLGIDSDRNTTARETTLSRLRNFSLSSFISLSHGRVDCRNF